MTKRELIDYCLTYPDAYEDYPFDPASDPDTWTAMRHKQNKKTFAFIFEREGLFINLKCEPMRADFLRSIYSGVTPAFHMNKVHWNSVRICSDVPDEELYAMIDHSYSLTKSKVKRK